MKCMCKFNNLEPYIITKKSRQAIDMRRALSAVSDFELPYFEARKARTAVMQQKNAHLSDSQARGALNCKKNCDTTLIKFNPKEDLEL